MIKIGLVIVVSVLCAQAGAVQLVVPEDKCGLEMSLPDRRIATKQGDVLRLIEHLDSVVLGQSHLTRDAVIALLVGGHVLIEGPHGTAKTTFVKELAESVSGEFGRVQMNPDTMPSDITGSSYFDHEKKKHVYLRGPIEANLVLVDEINRAPPRTQTGLFEPMAENQVTVGNESHPLPEVQLVFATQNPSKQLGTYPLPEPQLDRFLFQVVVGYQNHENELKILNLKLSEEAAHKSFKPLSLDDIVAARQEVKSVVIPEDVKSYIVRIISITRTPSNYPQLANRLLPDAGVSSRGTVGLALAAQAEAWLRGETTVSRKDVDRIFFDVLRHRIQLTEDEIIDGDGKHSDKAENVLRIVLKLASEG